MILICGLLVSLTSSSLPASSGILKYESTWSTSRLKELLQEKEGIDINQIRLIYGGKQMEDTRSIESYEMEPGSTIHMILQLRGG